MSAITQFYTACQNGARDAIKSLPQGFYKGFAQAGTVVGTATILKFSVPNAKCVRWMTAPGMQNQLVVGVAVYQVVRTIFRSFNQYSPAQKLVEPVLGRRIARSVETILDKRIFPAVAILAGIAASYSVPRVAVPLIPIAYVCFAIEIASAYRSTRSTGAFF